MFRVDSSVRCDWLRLDVANQFDADIHFWISFTPKRNLTLGEFINPSESDFL